MPRSPQSCHSRALDALSRRARSTQELTRWLRERDYPADEIADTISRLTASGLVDDAKFAESFARSRLGDRGLSRRRVAAELARRGVSRDVATAAMESVVADEAINERASVEAVAEKKYRTLRRFEPDVARRRLMAFLARRGYESDLVRDVVARLTKA